MWLSTVCADFYFHCIRCCFVFICRFMSNECILNWYYCISAELCCENNSLNWRWKKCSVRLKFLIFLWSAVLGACTRYRKPETYTRFRQKTFHKHYWLLIYCTKCAQKSTFNRCCWSSFTWSHCGGASTKTNRFKNLFTRSHHGGGIRKRKLPLTLPFELALRSTFLNKLNNVIPVFKMDVEETVDRLHLVKYLA